MVRLRRSETELSPRDYYDCRINEIGRFADDDLANVVGRRMRVRLQRMLNNPNWEAVVSDKLIMAMVFREAGIPQPELVAVATAYDRSCGEVPVLRTRHEIIDFLRHAPLPLFCKPIRGGYGDSCHRIDTIDVQPDTTDTDTTDTDATDTDTTDVDGASMTVTIDGGRSMPIDAFLDELHDASGWGFQFQKTVRPHPDTIPIAGDAVTGVRMVTLLGDDGPRLFRAVWKIPSVHSITDNYGDGATGNGVADVDVTTGAVKGVQWGLGDASSVDAPHPDTGTPVVGIRVPLWDDVVDQTLAATRALPGPRFQSWDVGLSSTGPVMFEMNIGGGTWDDVIPRGTYDPQLREFAAAYGHGVQHRRHRGVPRS